MALPARGGVGVWVVVCAALTILAAPWALGLPWLAFAFKPATALLWIGPGVLLVVALTALFVVLRRRQRMAADAFDPDTPDDADDHPVTR